MLFIGRTVGDLIREGGKRKW